ncbi:MAG TPA: hypothetical protein VK427_16870, partial [Kofleriaceae bacterium]|nr:hypothetical protein [Kofleriaceae bacterium]
MSVPRSSYAWIITAHTLAGAILGTLEAVRLGSSALGLALVPVFALTGLVAGSAIAGVTRMFDDRPQWIAALGIAAPSLLLTFPIAATLFRGAFAQTLPLAGAAPYVLPIIAWLGIAALVWIGRRLAAGDLTTRAIAICAVAGL